MIYASFNALKCFFKGFLNFTSQMKFITVIFYIFHYSIGFMGVITLYFLISVGRVYKQG